MAYERNWAFSFNNLHTVAAAVYNDATCWQLWSWKALLMGQLGGLVSGLWTCYSSCDSVAFGNGDGVDRWGSTYDPTKIVWGTAAAARSWFVLKSPAIAGSNFYIIFAHDRANDGLVYASACKTAPTGGTATAKPTSADEWPLGTIPTVSANDNAAVGTQFRSNVCLSSTGDFIFFTHHSLRPSSPGTIPQFGSMFINPVGCHASDQFPIFTTGYYSTAAGCFGYSGVGASVNGGNAARTGGNAAGFQTIITVGTPSLSFPDLLTGKFQALPAWVIVNATAGGTWHMRGRVPDIFVFGGNGNYTTNRVIRDGSNNITHVSIGNIFIPANAVPYFPL